MLSNLQLLTGNQLHVQQLIARCMQLQSLLRSMDNSEPSTCIKTWPDLVLQLDREVWRAFMLGWIATCICHTVG